MIVAFSHFVILNERSEAEWSEESNHFTRGGVCALRLRRKECCLFAKYRKSTETLPWD